MNSGKNSQSDQDPNDSYSILGLEKGASYESIRKARDKRLKEVGDDLIARAKIEAAYDSLLMVSLKSRQEGNVSNAAVSASRKEELNKGIEDSQSSSLLTKFKSINFSRVENSNSNFFSGLNFTGEDGLTIRISLGILALVILFISPPATVSTILSFSIIASLIFQVRAGKALFSSFIWSFALLAIGIIIGNVLFAGNEDLSIHTHLLPPENLKVIPSVVLLWLRTLLLG